MLITPNFQSSPYLSWRLWPYAPDAIYLALASSGREKQNKHTVETRESRQALERKRKTKEKYKVETPLCRPRRATAQFMLATQRSRRNQTSVRDRSVTPQNVRDLGKASPFPPPGPFGPSLWQIGTRPKLGPHAPRFSTVELGVPGGQDGGQGGKKRGGSGLARGCG